MLSPSPLDVTISPIVDADHVAAIIQTYESYETIKGIALAQFDNQRQRYSSQDKLEFAGLALTESQIEEMICLQAEELVHRASEYERIILLWKAESARWYANALAKRIIGTKTSVLKEAIETKWRDYNSAEVLGMPHFAKRESDYLAVVDFMCGSGGTLMAIGLWLNKLGIHPDCYFVLVNAINYCREPSVPMVSSPCYLWTQLDWLIGYNSDCLSNGKPIGRELPFLAFLRPNGSGIRNELCQLLNEGQ